MPYNELNNGIVLLFDIDDTICIHKNRDYENAMPMLDVIAKINALHNQGYVIKLYTSRGMNSCRGNVKKADRRNRRILEKWLQKHNVCYDELIFGKPLADLYVDDKAMSVKDFMETDSKFEYLQGGSGMSVNRIGKIVRKECDEDKINRITSWYSATRNIVRSPFINSITLNTIYMDYIKGRSLYYWLSQSKSELSLLFKKLLEDVEMFSKTNKNNYFDINGPINILKMNLGIDERVDIKIKNCIKLLESYSPILSLHSSLSHGDLILSNIQVDVNGDLWYLDSEYDSKSSSYLLDLAKIRMSLNNYEFHFNLEENRISSIYQEYFDKYLKELGIFNIVYVLQYMYMIRLLRYKTEPEREMIIAALNEMERRDKGGILI